ncbi:AbrB/MazE/SpoVT family DNA-binding domain-containing protein [Paenibacillus sp. Dod16]|uniref:AbrB/MazE/SpoVT family DNA-binding domain-containing protein n=1 Tax=Paenibacillus sp. Dod16 TaxID=3416392 RepID=UPI003CE6A55C
MKNTGIRRPVDELGRIVLPIELRRALGLDEGDTVEYFYDDEKERIILRKYRIQECSFCRSMEELTFYRDSFICNQCISEIRPQEVLEVAVALEDLEPNENQTMRRKGRKRKVSNEDLIRVMKSYPNVSQKIWAEMLEISQGRVSQMISSLKKSDFKFDVLESAIALEIDEEDLDEKKSRGNRSEALSRLEETIRVFPHASQRAWAEKLGFSQGYVSILLRDLIKQKLLKNH